MHIPRWKLLTYLLVIVLGLGAALPNVLPRNVLSSLPQSWQQTQVALGLDLRGGSHLVLEVDSEALVSEWLQNVANELRRELRNQAVSGASVNVEQTGLLVGNLVDSSHATVIKALNDLVPPVSRSAFATTTPGLDIVRLEDGMLRAGLTEAAVNDRVNAAVEQSLEIVRQRVDEVGVAEPTIQRVGPDRIMVQLPGVDDPGRLRQLLGSTAKMTFHMLADNVGMDGRIPPGVTMLPDASGGGSYPVVDRVALSGDRLTDARAAFDQQTNEPIVTFRFDGRGARQFADITRQNVGRPFAIVLDGEVLTAPVIREPITGGSGQISGSFTIEDTVVLSAMLRAGALPAPLTVIEERTVGPGLGSDAIEMGLYTGLAGFALVVAFMVALYGGWGLIANLALGLNIALIFGALSLIGATLTLPGIAGIILAIGMAVDANILINERIREETRKGASAFRALDIGFSRAYATIVDASVTTLLATALLFLFGSGPVKGFAVTMMLGIGISMFTAVAVVKVIMIEIVRRRKLKTLDIKRLINLAPSGTAISFMRARYLGIALSLILSVASVALFIHPGLAYGIDFKGGIQIEAQTSQPANLGELRQAVGALGLGEVTLQEFGDDHSVLIRAERQMGGEAAQTAALEAIRGAIAEIDPGASIERAEVVGPKVSGELARSGILAVALAGLAMLGYIWWRFEWHFAVGAIATLILDTTKMVGFFALTGLEFNLVAIAALLTIIGYSVNDKVVVYDRMRENLRLYKTMGFRELIDRSINQVLVRCVFTSVTTVLAMLPMAIWGGPAVASFAIPMVVGVVIATSSSIFIAAPILLFLGDWRHRRIKPDKPEAEPQAVSS